MMSEQEAEDIVVLRAAIQKAKLGCYEYLKTLNRLDVTGLEHSGYRGITNSEAMRDQFNRTERTIEKLIRAHEAKYPD